MDVAKLVRQKFAADETGLARQTLGSAIERGEITVYETACGLPLVALADVRQWAKNRPKRGRPFSGDAR